MIGAKRDGLQDQEIEGPLEQIGLGQGGLLSKFEGTMLHLPSKVKGTHSTV
jgi:hypothetical protein